MWKPFWLELFLRNTPFFLRAVGGLALRSNALSFRSIKGQSHHSAGTRNISVEGKL